MRYLLVILIFSFFRPAIALKTDTAFFLEKAGIISIEAENWEESRGWKSQMYYSGIGASPAKDYVKEDNFIIFNILFSTPGTYNVFLLGNRTRTLISEEQVFSLSLTSGDKNNMFVSSINISESKAPKWSRVYANNADPATIRVETPGAYILKIVGISGFEYSIDKIVICTPEAGSPSGTGPVESSRGSSPSIEKPDIILPPAWAFGILYGGYTDQQQTIEVVDSLIAGNFPIDAFWNDSYFWDGNAGKGPKGYIDFIGDTVAFPNAGAMWDALKKVSIKSGIWVWDAINETGNESVYHDFKSRGYFSREVLNTNSWHNSTRNSNIGDVDFTNPAAAEYWKSLMKPFFDKGVDFLKLDKSSAIPYVDAAFTASQQFGKETGGRGFILAHIMDLNDIRIRQYPTNWTGDAKICWTQPDYPDLGIYAMGGYKENIAMIADPKRTTYEVPFLTHDAGGYDYFGSTDQSEELYMRWIQFASMNSIMTIFSTAKNPTRNHPYRYSQRVQENFRKYTHLRMKLFPYIYSEALHSRLSGVKMIKGDGINEHQYLLGDQILVAPVYEQGATTRSLFLPEGRWIDFETDSVYTGGQNISITAPLEKLPMFVKEGAILPLRNYARTIDLGSNDTLTLEVYPSEQFSGYTLLEDDGTSNDYISGGYSSTSFHVMKAGKKGLRFSIDPVQGSFKGMSEDRTYILRIHNADNARKVKIGKHKIPRVLSTINPDFTGSFSYTYDDRVLTILFNADKNTSTRITIN